MVQTINSLFVHGSNHKLMGCSWCVKPREPNTLKQLEHLTAGTPALQVLHSRQHARYWQERHWKHLLKMPPLEGGPGSYTEVTCREVACREVTCREVACRERSHVVRSHMVRSHVESSHTSNRLLPKFPVQESWVCSIVTRQINLYFLM